jgi:hypothetical protein
MNMNMNMNMLLQIQIVIGLVLVMTMTVITVIPNAFAQSDGTLTVDTYGADSKHDYE